uniref:Tf2-1-like SH3-like domain-containing protein n=1 Tax=Nicotiana tabacum TaxID=4097 RepID=A0A1S4BJ69_TOBAC|nr:PREDICTED: uncharacterized protein LOC107808886 [Nicotiana tabacum]
MAQSCQKSYSDVRHRELEFQVDVWVLMKVSLMKGVMRFRKKGKLSPLYIGPYRILRRIGQVAYELEFSQELVAVHPVFHLSMLKKFMGDPSLVVPTEIIGVKDSLTYEEIPVAILDSQIRKLRTKEIASAKVVKIAKRLELVRRQEREEWEVKRPHSSGGFSMPHLDANPITTKVVIIDPFRQLSMFLMVLQLATVPTVHAQLNHHSVRYRHRVLTMPHLHRVPWAAIQIVRVSSSLRGEVVLSAGT